jgi:hypothetical protein
VCLLFNSPVSPRKKLCILQGIYSIYAQESDVMDYISIAEAAIKWDITPRRIQVLCAEGRIPGAARLGRAWAIPKDAKKPTDARIKSGKYISRTEY